MTAPDPLIGSHIGPYRIVGFLGAGGMGVVYRAESTAGATIALKLLAPELTRNPDFRDRFSREAQWHLEHPNILPIYDSGDAGGHLYIAMHLVEGGDLKQLLAVERTLTPRRAVSIFEQVGAALDAAHAEGVVHRDVKPQNILLERRDEGDEHAFLSDFGLVKRVAGQTSLTAASHLIGTAHYMAPELIQGDAIDGRSDVYGLGCVLFEALTGDVPYPMDEEVAVLWAHVHKPVPKATEKVPSLPEAVDEVLSKALAKDPSDRYLTAGDFIGAAAAALGHSKDKRVRPLTLTSGPLRHSGPRQAGTGTSGPVAAASSTSASRGFVVGVAATIALLLGGIAFQSEGVREVAASAVERGRDVVDAVTGGSEMSSPRARGKRRTNEPRRRRTGSLAAAIGAPARPSSAAAGDISAPTRTGPKRRSLPVVGPAAADPDRRAIVFVSLVARRGGVAHPSDGALYAADPNGRNIRLLYDEVGISDDYDPAYSPDGSRLAFTTGFRLAILRLDGAGEVLTLPCPTAGWCREPSWSPDGERLVFTASPDQYPPSERWGLWVINADGSSPRPLYDGAHPDVEPAWSPDGSWIAFRTGGASSTAIAAVRPDGSGFRMVVDSRHDETHPSWSPDAGRLAFERGQKIYVLREPHGDVTRVTRGRDSEPVWSPSGRWIVFTRTTGSRVDIFKARSHGSSPPINISDGFGQSAAW